MAYPSSSFPLPSPSPLTSTTTSTSTSTTSTPCTAPPTSSSKQWSWHYPGASTRFHVSERPKLRHSRFQSSTTTPVAPSLSTERRAHRRTQSSALLARGSSSTTSPAISAEYSPSPSPSPSPLLRFPFTTNATMPSTITMNSPRTPAKQVLKHADATGLRDSPFSDYFTDDARSTENSSYDMPSTQTQHMLVRLSKLQAQLMRAGEEGTEALNIVGRKLGEMEKEMDALHSQTRVAPELDDSGLFMDDEEEEEESEESEESVRKAGAEFGDVGGEVTPEEQAAERDYQLLEAQRVLEDITHAQEQLRQRHAELVQLNDDRAAQIEDYEQEVERLRSENEGLRSDLGFDHGELLFMKLQLKSLEVEVSEEIGEREEDQVGSFSGSGARLLEEMESWRADWHDVDARFRRRRTGYGVVSAEDKGFALFGKAGREDDGGQWDLEIVKERDGSGGRVGSVTIRRVDGEKQPLGSDGSVNEEAESGDAQDPYPKASPISDQAQIEVSRAPQEQLQHSATAAQSWYTDHTTQTLPTPQTYTSTSTSTQSDPFIPQDSEPSINPLPISTNEDEDEDEDTPSECAITTSPSSPSEPFSPSPVLSPREAVPMKLPSVSLPQAKTAWRELWEGLHSLAGMGGDEEEG